MNLPRPAVFLPLLFATLVAGFSIWLERRVNLLTQPTVAEPAAEIDLVSGELVVDVYSDAGLPTHHVEADHAVHYLANDRTALERPRVTSLRDDVHFTGRAQRADVFNHGERVEAFGDVLVTRLLDGAETRYEGQMLIWWPDDGRARSDLPVVITRGERRATGDRMEAEDQLSKITLIGNAHVHWPPEPKAAANVLAPAKPAAGKATAPAPRATPSSRQPAPRRSPSR
ncbi:LPS export ABC transporter periplasmic protein LptC [Tepidiphilus margaritifer]|uniref:LPS export ABC transporter periplasmic protein LptC n=1 Tax=Tepidiphilus margaritifer TaxID=203471 RepID=UPI0003FDCE4E|nr:LPS export ABC transporter periplasmic protein LptC [Tepidiphilus margaritifer]